MAFNEKLEKKLKKILAKAGLEEDKIEKVLEDVEGELAEEEVPDDSNPDESENQPSEEVVEESTTEQTPEEEAAPVEETPAEEVVEEVAKEEVPPQPNDGSIESTVNSLVEGLNPSEPQEEVPPQEEVVPVEPKAPQIDPQVQDLLSKNEELQKAVDGLLSRVASLEDALKNAGVIDGNTPIGDERPTLPESASGQGNILNEVLNHINGKSI